MTTLKSAKATLAAVGVTINKSRWNLGEYRVALAGNADSAYFTDDIDDAVATGLAMARHAFMHDFILSGRLGEYVLPDGWAMAAKSDAIASAASDMGFAVIDVS